MAHSAKLAGLAGELVTAFTKISPEEDRQTFEALKQSTLRTLRESRVGRTNQFDVYNRLDGLQEKFRVLNNDELADALAVRLEELSQASLEWTPEVLSLFLELSDQPAQKSSIKSLERLKRPDPPPPLTWADIFADDPLDNKDGVWDNVDFAAETSDDDSRISPDRLSLSEGTGDSTVHDGDQEVNIEALIVHDDESELRDIVSAQFWNKEEILLQIPSEKWSVQSKCQVTETQLLREVMFMLLGLRTSVYIQDREGQFTTDRKYSIQHAQEMSVLHVLDSYAAIGNGLVTLRTWTAKKQEVPLVQAFQAAVETRLFAVDRLLAEMQADMLTPFVTSSATLLGQLPKVQEAVRLVLQVSDILTQLDPIAEGQIPFKILEFLHGRTASNQDIGDIQGYAYMARLFFECFDSYLKPITLWMEAGELGKYNEMFFVRKEEGDLALTALWQAQYTLRRDENGHLHAPNFLHLAVTKVFTTGKSVTFLRQLGDRLGEDMVHGPEVSRLDYETVCQGEENDTLSPFSELFSRALERWIAGKHHASSNVLRDRLETRCGLWRTLDAMENIYFSCNGALTSTITCRIFERIDRGKEAWNDRFLLTELFQGVFGELACIDAERLTIRSAFGNYHDMQNRRRSVKILNSITVNYALPWPIANVIGQGSLSVHQRIFVFLAQVYRAKYMLERRRLLKSTLCPLDSEDGENSLVYSLRHRLLWFTNTLHSYLTEAVLSITTSEMRMKLAKAEDVDAMISTYEAYIMHLEDQCLLSKKLAPIHQAIISLLDLSILFSDSHASYAGEKLFDLTNRSIISNTSQLQSIHPRRRKASDASSSEGDDVDNDGEVDVSYVSFTEVPYVDRLRKMHDSFTKLGGFVTAGLRGVSRAGGEACWEVLAENLVLGTLKGRMV
ncbi:MAG: Gamma-tubulin complex component GCP5 [Lasallia pustulata]|uniref:Spindle pole body component n=1 Tax=Lasallia pustulata TaxID=136370 RepID=A0A5M8PCF0_9LECA|nr:MAG: Gamma-tubulin complex component GCP5 [Lasallia pustulata]